MPPTRSRLTRRTLFLGGAGAAALLRAPAVLGQAKSKYAGRTIRGAAFSLPFHEYLKKYFPEFEDQTGIWPDPKVAPGPTVAGSGPARVGVRSTHSAANSIIPANFSSWGR